MSSRVISAGWNLHLLSRIAAWLGRTIREADPNPPKRSPITTLAPSPTPTAVTTAPTPMMIPSRVSAVLDLLLRTAVTASYSRDPSFTPLLLGQSHNGVQAARLHGRVDPKEEPYGRGDTQPYRQGKEGSHVPPALKRGHTRGYTQPQQDADPPTDQADDHGLDQKLRQDIDPLGSNGLADPYLLGALGDRDQHDVHDTNAAHHQGNPGHQGDDRCDDPEDLVERVDVLFRLVHHEPWLPRDQAMRRVQVTLQHGHGVVQVPHVVDLDHETGDTWSTKPGPVLHVFVDAVGEVDGGVIGAVPDERARSPLQAVQDGEVMLSDQDSLAKRDFPRGEVGTCDL